MKYRKNDGKEGLLTFGLYPAVTLEQARKLRDEAKARKATGVDPGLARREEKAERVKRAQNTFEAVARTWMEVHGAKVKPQTMHIYKVVLEKCVFPLSVELRSRIWNSQTSSAYFDAWRPRASFIRSSG